MRSFEREQALLRSFQLTWKVLFLGRYDFVFDQIPISIRNMSMAKRLNLFKSGFNLFYRRLTPWSMPLHMQFELTNYCNLHCPICPTGNRQLSRPHLAMDPDLFRRVMKEVGPYLLTASLWGWGESLLHPKLITILNFMQDHNIFSMLSTNGQNLNCDNIIQSLIKSPPTHLIVALDGLTDETNSRFRIGARLQPALSGVRRLAEIKKQTGASLPVLHMRYIVMKHNQHEVSQLKDFAAMAGFDFLSIRTLAPVASDGQGGIYENLLPDESEFRAFIYQEGGRVQRNDFICYHPYWFPSLFSDGTLVACGQDHNAEEPIGSVKENASFAGQWFGRNARNIRKKLRDHAGTISSCRNCPFRDRPTSHFTSQFLCINPDISTPFVIRA
jgi:MoaA/NifB/PqqE/SkfB family radical SAM enzyme